MRFRDDGGQALVMAMAFLAFFGIVIGAMVGFARASVGTTEALTIQRSRTYAADAALETAILAGRRDPNVGAFGASPCMHSPAFTIPTTSTDGTTTATVTCAATQPPLADRDVVFTAKIGTVTVAKVEVRYLDDPLTPGSTSQAQVLKWTYCGHDTTACT